LKAAVVLLLLFRLLVIFRFAFLLLPVLVWGGTAAVSVGVCLGGRKLNPGRRRGGGGGSEVIFSST
jgi:hypothetical protein